MSSILTPLPSHYWDQFVIEQPTEAGNVFIDCIDGAMEAALSFFANTSSSEARQRARNTIRGKMEARGPIGGNWVMLPIYLETGLVQVCSAHTHY